MYKGLTPSVRLSLSFPTIIFNSSSVIILIFASKLGFFNIPPIKLSFVSSPKKFIFKLFLFISSTSPNIFLSLSSKTT